MRRTCKYLWYIKRTAPEGRLSSLYLILYVSAGDVPDAVTGGQAEIVAVIHIQDRTGFRHILVCTGPAVELIDMRSIVVMNFHPGAVGIQIHVHRIIIIIPSVHAACAVIRYRQVESSVLPSRERCAGKHHGRHSCQKCTCCCFYHSSHDIFPSLHH